MENAQKAIIIGVGIFILIIIIGAVILITGMGQDMSSTSIDQLSGTTNNLLNSFYEKYDNKVFKGAEVRQFIKYNYNSKDISIAVKNYYVSHAYIQYGFGYCGATGMPFDYGINGIPNGRIAIKSTYKIDKFKTYNAQLTNSFEEPLKQRYSNKVPLKYYSQPGNVFTYIPLDVRYKSSLVYYEDTKEICGILFTKMDYPELEAELKSQNIYVGQVISNYNELEAFMKKCVSIGAGIYIDNEISKNDPTKRTRYMVSSMYSLKENITDQNGKYEVTSFEKNSHRVWLKRTN